MQDIGKILINARTEKGLELDEVARETNISKDYLQGLETDTYTMFPAETYVVGFLKNYADYLGLDGNEIVESYKRVQIQESEIHNEILLPKKSFPAKQVGVALVAICVLGLVGFGGYKIVSAVLDKQNTDTPIVEQIPKTQTVISEQEAQVYDITSENFEERLFDGDKLTYKLDETTYEFTIKKTSPELEIETPVGLQIIGLSESLPLDLNNDLEPEIQITVADLDKNNPNRGALLMIATGTNISTTAPLVDPGESLGESNQNLANSKVLFEGGSAYPVTLNATFRGVCFFRYEIDRGNRTEKYYQRNETLTIQANDGFRIWASSGNAVRFQLVGGGRTVELDVTKAGEVIVQDLKWVRDENGRYKFMVINVD